MALPLRDYLAWLSTSKPGDAPLVPGLAKPLTAGGTGGDSPTSGDPGDTDSSVSDASAADAALGGTSPAPTTASNPVGTPSNPDMSIGSPANPGMSLSAAHGATVGAAGSGALSGAIGGITGGLSGTSSPAATAIGMALSALTGMPGMSVAANAVHGAATSQTNAISGLTGLTSDQISAGIADANAAVAAGPSGAAQSGEEPERRQTPARPSGAPPANLSLKDYLDWVHAVTEFKPFGGMGQLRTFDTGGAIPKPGLKQAILAEGGEFVVARKPAVKYRKLLDAINAGAPPKKVRSLLEAMG